VIEVESLLGIGLLAGQAEELSSYLSRDRAVSVPLLTTRVSIESMEGRPLEGRMYVHARGVLRGISCTGILAESAS
jgi:hypothetical protein